MNKITQSNLGTGHTELSTGHNGAPHIRPQNYPSHGPILPASSLDLSDLPSQIASISDQPVLPQCTRETDIQTDQQVAGRNIR